jgi:hypothetical protein
MINFQNLWSELFKFLMTGVTHHFCLTRFFKFSSLIFFSKKVAQEFMLFYFEQQGASKPKN